MCVMAIFYLKNDPQCLAASTNKGKKIKCLLNSKKMLRGLEILRRSLEV